MGGGGFVQCQHLSPGEPQEGQRKFFMGVPGSLVAMDGCLHCYDAGSTPGWGPGDPVSLGARPEKRKKKGRQASSFCRRFEQLACQGSQLLHWSKS